MVALDQASCGGSWLPITTSFDPETVCCPESLLVVALRSVGVETHPGFGFQKFVDERGEFWRWVVSTTSADGTYATADLLKWWSDEDWLAANRSHEWAIARAVLTNMARQAAEIRDQVTMMVVRKGRAEAHIPVDASPALRAFRLGQLEGRIGMNEVFIEPEPEPDGLIEQCPRDKKIAEIVAELLDALGY